MDKTAMLDQAFIGEQFVRGPIRGVVLALHGLGGMGPKGGVDTDELEWAGAGGLVVFPYYGPWSWMNRQARGFIDDLVASVYTHYKLGPEIPVIVTGGSMGGLSALLYTRYAKKPPVACLAVFPVCDLAFHFQERPDLPRSIRGAFMGYSEPLEQLLAEHSALAQVPGMPRIPYQIIHGDADQAVNKAAHSDRFVAAMRQAGHQVDYMEVPGMGHGSNVPLSVLQRRIEFVQRFLKR
jgi:dipeptidyl aminopeptidase/acylaminoacyl peptidase